VVIDRLYAARGEIPPKPLRRNGKVKEV